MDGQRFDALTRALARGATRRRLLRVLGGGTATGLLALGERGRVAAVDCADRCNQLPAGAGRDRCLDACVAATQTSAEGDAARAYAQALRDCDGDDSRLCGSGADITCCAADEVCTNGTCSAGESPCPNGQTACGDNCVDLSSDPNNCGGCGQVCRDSPANGFAVCTDGQCGIGCDGGFSLCGGVCCPIDYYVCNNEVCGCPDGEVDCGNGCIDLATDPANCNGCGIDCETDVANAHPICTDGHCGFACNDGYNLCGETCCASDHVCQDGQCVCLAGTCGCPPNETNCGDGCVDLLTDLHNCGRCGEACFVEIDHSISVCSGGNCGFVCESGYTICGLSCCPDSLSCVNGLCVCPDGKELCGDGCIDVVSDPSNCGSCGHICQQPDVANAHAVCTSGRCGYECDAGFVRCGDLCYPAESLPANCSQCGQGCHQTGQICCDGVCADILEDPKNCGRCGQVCDTTGGQTCHNGACACPVGTTACASGCVDVSLDLANCGACGHACGNGQICRLGHCLTPCNNVAECPDGCGCAPAHIEPDGKDGLICVIGSGGSGRRCVDTLPFTTCPAGEVCLPTFLHDPYCAELCGV